MIRNYTSTEVTEDFYVFAETEQIMLLPKKMDNTIGDITIIGDKAVTTTRDGKKYENKVGELDQEILTLLDSRGLLVFNNNNETEMGEESDNEEDSKSKGDKG